MLIRSGAKCIKGDFNILTQLLLVLQGTETMPFPRFAEAETNKQIPGRVCVGDEQKSKWLLRFDTHKEAGSTDE